MRLAPCRRGFALASKLLLCATVIYRCTGERADVVMRGGASRALALAGVAEVVTQKSFD